MLDLRKFKQAVISYSMYLAFVKQMLNSWTTRKRIIPQDWKELITTVLEDVP